MAIKHGSQYFTRFVHLENGNVLNRRIHRLEIQARDGRMYVVQGDKLPDFIQLSTGAGHQGEHVGQILLNPQAARLLPSPETRPWPCGRDLLNVAVVFFAVAMLRFVASLAGIG